MSLRIPFIESERKFSIDFKHFDIWKEHFQARLLLMTEGILLEDTHFSIYLLRFWNKRQLNLESCCSSVLYIFPLFFANFIFFGRQFLNWLSKFVIFIKSNYLPILEEKCEIVPQKLPTDIFKHIQNAGLLQGAKMWHLLSFNFFVWRRLLEKRSSPYATIHRCSNNLCCIQILSYTYCLKLWGPWDT